MSKPAAKYTHKTTERCTYLNNNDILCEYLPHLLLSINILYAADDRNLQNFQQSCKQ